LFEGRRWRLLIRDFELAPDGRELVVKGAQHLPDIVIKEPTADSSAEPHHALAGTLLVSAHGECERVARIPVTS
jgi:hypothetical protein